MARIRGYVASVLTFVNIIGIISIFVLTMTYFDKNGRRLRELSILDNPHPHLRGTKLKLIKIKSEITNEISKSTKYYDPSYYPKDEFVFEEKKMTEKIHLKKLRQLSLYKKDVISYVLFAEIGAIFSTFILMCSFCLEKNECCNENAEDQFCFGICICCLCCDDDCSHCNCNCDCKNSGGGNNDGAAALLIFLLFILVFVALYFAIKACGKNVSRYFGIVGNFLVNLGILGLMISYGINDSLPIVIVSGILALVNFLGILLPSLSSCECLTSGYQKNQSVINAPLVQNQPQINNKSTPANEPALVNAPLYPPTTPIYAPQNNSIYPPPQVPSNYPPPQFPQNYPPPENANYISGGGGIYS